MNPTYDVEYYKKTGVKIPPPHRRLCLKHHKPIRPSQWLAGGKRRSFGCAGCEHDYCRSPKYRKRRTEKYQLEDIRCAKHPNRRAYRADYIHGGARRCAWCHKHRADGSMTPARKRQCIKSERKRQYKKSLERRTQRLSGALYGVRLFERSTGMRLSDFVRTHD